MSEQWRYSNLAVDNSLQHRSILTGAAGPENGAVVRIRKHRNKTCKTGLIRLSPCLNSYDLTGMTREEAAQRLERVFLSGRSGFHAGIS